MKCSRVSVDSRSRRCHCHAAAGLNSTGRRSALAAWLTDPKNPLPARVIVNRIWNYNFGEGIVKTPGDFGMMGSRPTHPNFWTIWPSTFVENGWSMKKLNRMILLSNTYQQSSAFEATAAAADPDDNLIWRYPRHRLEAEAIRDSMLSGERPAESADGRARVFSRRSPKVRSRNSPPLRRRAAGRPKRTRRRTTGAASISSFGATCAIPCSRSSIRPTLLKAAISASQRLRPSQSLDLLNNDLVLEWAQPLRAAF